MSLVDGEIQIIGMPEQAGEPREGKAVALLIVVDDPRPAGEALEAFSAPDAPVVPNYYLDQLGGIWQLVADERAGNGLELAIHEGRRRNIDRVSLSIFLEYSAEFGYSDAQILALRRLVESLREKHSLGAEAVAAILPDARGRARVTPIALPPPPIVDDGAVLGAGADSPDQQLYDWLLRETWAVRAAPGQPNTAFAYYAAQKKLGAPLAPHGRTSTVSVGGRTYFYQVFARDTLYYQGEDVYGIQSLRELIDRPDDLSELAVALLSASYTVSQQATQARVKLEGTPGYRGDWRFHLVAANSGFGPALSGNYNLNADQKYPFQVFACETLFTPATEQTAFSRLSVTEASHPAYAALWQETYRYAGAPYDPGSPFHQRALADGLGAPLTGVVRKALGPTTYTYQVFACDTLFAGPDGAVRRMSDLPLPGLIAGWSATQPRTPQPAPTPRPAPPPAPRPGAIVVPAFKPVPKDPNWPPKPTFWSLGDRERVQHFGFIDWVPAPNKDEARAIRIKNNWVAENLVDVEVPQLKKFVKSGTVKFHRVAAEGFRHFWAEVERLGYLHLVLSWSGTWNPRVMTSDYSKLSNHAYGTAFDINVKQNGWQQTPAVVGAPGSVRELVPIANACGFFWGGHWDKRWSDGMHFEWAAVKK